MQVTHSHCDIKVCMWSCLQGYPEYSGNDCPKDSFSYRVSVSCDEFTWKNLFDYSYRLCYGMQRLTFPETAARYNYLDNYYDTQKIRTC